MLQVLACSALSSLLCPPAASSDDPGQGRPMAKKGEMPPATFYSPIQIARSPLTAGTTGRSLWWEAQVWHIWNCSSALPPAPRVVTCAS